MKMYEYRIVFIKKLLVFNSARSQWKDRFHIPPSPSVVADNMAPAVIPSIVYSYELNYHPDLNQTFRTAMPDMDKTQNTTQIQIH